MAKVADEQAGVTYRVAERIVEQGLRRDGSLFTAGAPIWTRDGLSDLKARFVDRPDTSKDSFENKFRRQLAGAPAATIQLAAELVYLNLLVTRPVLGKTKRELVKEILSWAGLEIEQQQDVSDALDHGLVNPGQAYAVQKPFALAFLIEFLLRWKALGDTDRADALASPWKFKELVFAEPARSAIGQQYALLHFVFPDTFEPIVSDAHKRLIARRFAEGSETMEPDSDRQLLQIRARLTPQYGDRFNFYRDPLRAQWYPTAPNPPHKPPKAKGPAVVPPRVWIEKTYVAGRVDRTDGPHGLGRALWSPQTSEGGREDYRSMREVQPGDVVLHLVDKRAFVGVSRIAGPPDDSFVGLAGTPWADQAAIRVPLTDYVQLDPPLDRTDFFSPEDVRRELLQIRRDYQGLFYDKTLTLHQGAYLTEAPPPLVTLLSNVYRSKVGRPLPYVVEGPPHTDPQPSAALSLDLLSELTLWPKSTLEEVVDLFTSGDRQVVLAGPPGTSKTWIAELLARYLSDDDPQRRRLVQFHPSYTYEAFVEGLRPVSEGGAIQFKIVPGIVREFAAAIGTRPKPHVLVIDEMNRANLPKVLGELMYLFEYRNHSIDLPYTRDFRLPENLWFIGTMNTADRSIRSIDVALRRRFIIVDCPPDAGILQRYYAGGRENRVDNLLSGFTALNAELTRVLDRHHTIGHSFFMADTMTRENLDKAWRHKIGPLLDEYFFDQPDTADSFTVERFWPDVS